MGPVAPDVTQVDLDGRICVYSPGVRQALVLNETASDIWRLSDGEHTLEEIIALLAVAYNVDRETIGPEVQSTIRSFLDAGLLAPPSAR